MTKLGHCEKFCVEKISLISLGLYNNLKLNLHEIMKIIEKCINLKEYGQNRTYPVKINPA